MNRKLALFNFIVAALLFLTACQAETETPDSTGKLKVVATTGQIADTLAHIAGDAIELTGLFGPGIDPHLYVPTEGDVATLGEADIIFYNGLHLEAQMTRVLEQLSLRGVTVVGVGDLLPEDQLLRWQSNTPWDPHIWNDLGLWRLVVIEMRDGLIAADPVHASQYQQNSAAFLAEMAETDAFIRQQIERIPAQKRVMITAHDAFGYFARTYGLEVRGLQGISTESEAGTNDVQALADFIVAREVPAIFVESSVPPRTIEAVQAAAQAKGFDVHIGGQLYSDALGTPGTPEGTYIGMLRYNAQTLADALSQ